MECLLKLENISKSFFGVQVLKNAHFDLYKGEIHALLGENGAGKSTLIKIISGAYKADSGIMTLNEKRIEHHGPKAAEALGIVTIYQNFHLIPHLSVAENVALQGFTSRGQVFIDWRAVNSQASETLAKLDFAIDSKAKVKDLSVAKKQMLEIAIAIAKNAGVLIMDEPTAALSKRETELLFKMMRQLKEKGIGIIYVSHKLEEIKELGDRVTILRDGKNVATVEVKETPLREIIELMIGRALTTNQDYVNKAMENSILSLKDIENEHFGKPLTLSLRENEILGITGLVGAGKTELARVIFGVDRKDRGEMWMNGKEVRIKGPRSAVKAGIGYLPEDRDREGLCLNMGIKENVTLALLAKIKRVWIDGTWENNIVSRLARAINIRAASVFVQVKYLSGGNKQKVVFAKWLEAEGKVLILDEPTIGIDIGARKEIYDLVQQFVGKPGRAVIFISSDMNEILEIADRILVMANYQFVAELKPRETNKQELMEYSMSFFGRTGKGV